MKFKINEFVWAEHPETIENTGYVISQYLGISKKSHYYVLKNVDTGEEHMEAEDLIRSDCSTVVNH